jgi:hypothetical protein
MIDQYNYGFSGNNQLCYQHENSNDITYWKILVDAAEDFFNRMIKELEHVSINRIIEAFISGSISSQLTKNSILDSKAVILKQMNGSEKWNPLQ